jgi:PAS domain S-box-containing protein
MARIMVVEDEPIVATDLERMLTSIGHEVAGRSEAGKDAVEKAKEIGPDLVFVDVRLQGKLSGIEAAERIRETSSAEGSTTAVVFLTALADKKAVERACRTRPYAYLVKPWTERSVAAAVRVALSLVEEEHELHERERFLSSALRSLGEALVAVDPSGRLRFVNAHAVALLKLDEHDLLGEDALRAIRLLDADSNDPISPLELSLREGRVTATRARLVGHDGEVRRVELSAAPMLDPEGRMIGAILAFREDDALGAFASDARHGESELSLRVQHEINSPLTYNLGALSIALREIDTLRAMRAIDATQLPTPLRAEEQDARLGRIEGLLRSAHKGAARVAAVMRELRSSALLELRPVPIEPVAIVELAVGACDAELEFIRVVRETEPAPMVRGNKWQLARALADELKLAVAALDSSGSYEATLALHTGEDARGFAEMRLSVRGRRLATRERMSGEGPEASRPGTVDASDEASDRAAAVSEVVAAHAGELIVRDEDDARVIALFLPPLKLARKKKSEEAHAGEPRRGSVLVIDDEPMIGRVLELTLSAHHDVTAVESAERALELLERGDAFDVILCDLSMPRMNGQEFYERLARSRPEAAERVIIMSGGARDAKGRAFLEAMRGRRLDKPFLADQLAPLIAERMKATGSERPSS